MRAGARMAIRASSVVVPSDARDLGFPDPAMFFLEAIRLSSV